MRELPIAEAAAVLGCSVDTIRRRIKRGELLTLKNSRGGVVVLVDLPEASTPQVDPVVEELRRELQHAKDLLAEVGRQRDQMEGQIVALQDALQRDAVERGELRQLLGMAQGQLQRLLPGPAEEVEDTIDKPQRRRWWPFGGG